MKVHKALAGIFLALGGGCASVSYELPPPSDAALSDVAREIRTAKPRTLTLLALPEAEARINAVLERLHPTAAILCRELGERGAGDCGAWEVSITENNELNAYATGERTVVLHSGLAVHAQNDAEIAFVIAHEFAHHMLDHINETGGNVALGQLIGMAAGAVLGGGAEGGYAAASDVISTSGDIGGWVARQRFSRAQEREADLIATTLLERAGYSPREARRLLIHMARLGGAPGLRSSFFDTHPVGPERLAHLDEAIRRVVAGAGNLPVQAN